MKNKKRKPETTSEIKEYNLDKKANLYPRHQKFKGQKNENSDNINKNINTNKNKDNRIEMPGGTPPPPSSTTASLWTTK